MGQSLAKGSYADAERFPLEGRGHPGLAVSSNAVSCETLIGEFEVTDLRLSAEEALAFTATFVQYCDESPEALRGCVHFE